MRTFLPEQDRAGKHESPQFPVIEETYGSDWRMRQPISDTSFE